MKLQLMLLKLSCQPLIIHKFLNNNLKRIFMYTLIHKEKYQISVIKFSMLYCAIQYSLMQHFIIPFRFQERSSSTIDSVCLFVCSFVSTPLAVLYMAIVYIVYNHYFFLETKRTTLPSPPLPYAPMDNDRPCQCTRTM